MSKLEKGFAGVVTGASTGIGKAVCAILAQRYRARLVINARTEAALDEARKLIADAGGTAVVHAGDCADKAIPAALVDRCMSEFGSIDLLVNNAGLAKPGAVTKLTVADWEHVFAVNFFAPLIGIYAALPHFQSAGRGKIVNISSVAGKIAFPGSVCYAASKFALTGMSEGMAAELAADNIDVITVCPGWVRTEFFKKNQVADLRNPTLIAAKNNVSGLLMRHLLSISSEHCAAEIERALRRSGSAELVLTAPGIAAERLHALFPNAIHSLFSRIPIKYTDTSTPV